MVEEEGRGEGEPEGPAGFQKGRLQVEVGDAEVPVDFHQGRDLLEQLRQSLRFEGKEKTEGRLQSDETRELESKEDQSSRHSKDRPGLGTQFGAFGAFVQKESKKKQYSCI